MEKFKVGIDARALETSTKNRGIGYFTFNVLSSILKKKRGDVEFIFYSTWTGKLQEKLSSVNSINFFRMPTLLRPRRRVRRFDLIFIPIWKNVLQRSKPDIMHITSLFEVYYLKVPENIPFVVTLYDLIPIIFNKQYFANKKAEDWYLMRLDQAKKAAKIITISKSAKEDIVKILKIPESKVEVIYGGFDKKFKVLKGKNYKKTLSKYGINRPYVMAVGAQQKGFFNNLGTHFIDFIQTFVVFAAIFMFILLKTSRSHLAYRNETSLNSIELSHNTG